MPGGHALRRRRSGRRSTAACASRSARSSRPRRLRRPKLIKGRFLCPNSPDATERALFEQYCRDDRRPQPGRAAATSACARSAGTRRIAASAIERDVHVESVVHLLRSHQRWAAPACTAPGGGGHDRARPRHGRAVGADRCGRRAEPRPRDRGPRGRRRARARHARQAADAAPAADRDRAEGPERHDPARDAHGRARLPRRRSHRGRPAQRGAARGAEMASRARSPSDARIPRASWR